MEKRGKKRKRKSEGRLGRALGGEEERKEEGGKGAWGGRWKEKKEKEGGGGNLLRIQGRLSSKENSAQKGGGKAAPVGLLYIGRSSARIIFRITVHSRPKRRKASSQTGRRRRLEGKEEEKPKEAFELAARPGQRLFIGRDVESPAFTWPREIYTS